jgi:hypothetical protein
LTLAVAFNDYPGNSLTDVLASLATSIVNTSSGYPMEI